MKNIIKSLIILLIPFCFFNLIFSFSKFSTSDFLELRKLNNVPASIQIANTGSSHGWNFDYSGIADKTCFNLSLRAQPLIYDEAVFKNFAKNFAPNSVLLIPVSYFEIDSIPNPEFVKGFECRYYLSINEKNIPNANLSDYIKYKYFLVSTQKNPIETIKSNFSKSVELLKTHNYEQEQDGNFALLSPEKQKNEAEFVKSSWENMYIKNGEKGKEYNKKILLEMIDICRKNKITPVVVTTPITEVQNEIFEKDDFFATFDSFKDEISKDADVIWLDYSRDNEFSNLYDLFIDTNHMSKKGRQLFTKKVMQDLTELNLVK